MKVDNIKENYSIKEELESRGIKVNRNGFCNCIFHKEKTASMKIYPNNSFYCFGCGRSGDVISVVMQLENLDFKSACKSLSGECLDAVSQKRICLNQMARNEKKRKERKRQEALDTVRKRIIYYTKIKNCSEPMSNAWTEAVNKLENEYYREAAILNREIKP